MDLYLAELSNSKVLMSDWRDVSSGVLEKVSVFALSLHYDLISEWNEDIHGRHIRFMEDERLDETANIWRKDTALRNRCPEIFSDAIKMKLIAKYKLLYIGSKAIITEIT